MNQLEPKFQFNIALTDQDYLDFNNFCQIRSAFGKRQIRIFRILIGIIGSVFSLLLLFYDGFSMAKMICIPPVAAVAVLGAVFFPKFLSLFIKLRIKRLSKGGKLLYSPQSIMEFYEDHFSEAVPEMKAELNYSKVERVYIVDGTMVYIFLNPHVAYILPVRSMESQAQYQAFLDFIKTKCANVDVDCENPS